MEIPQLYILCVWMTFLTACLEREKKANAFGDMLASDRKIRK